MRKRERDPTGRVTGNGEESKTERKIAVIALFESD